MQLVVKIAAEYADVGPTIIERTVAEILPDEVRGRTRISAVFPGVSSGRRAGLFTIDLPDEIPAEQIEPLIRVLREEKRVEYTQTAEDKRAL